MIVVFGATGYTGRLVVSRMAELGVPFVLAGRSTERLAVVAGQLGGVDPLTLRTADATDLRSLRAMLDGADALLNCAGPFATLGPPVVRACIEAGVPYCDVTGEAGFVRHVEGLHAAASVPLVPACGFYFVPHGLAAALAVAGVESPHRVETLVWVRGFVPAPGSRASALRVLRVGGYAVRNGATVPVSTVGAQRRMFDLPDGSQVAALSYPGGDALQIHHAHPEVQDVSSYIAPPGVATPLVRPLVEGARWLSGVPAAAGALDRLLRRASSGRGPRPSVRRRARFAVIAEARGAAGDVARAVVQGRDVYGSTAISAVEIARRLASWRRNEIEPGFRTPSQIFGDVRELAEACRLTLST